MTGLLPLADAQALLLAQAKPLAEERVPLGDAQGRYLAEPLIARRTQPAADLSAMDGYAVKADDLSGPWAVIGESAAGHPFAASREGGLARSEAVRISTGAVMPEGAGAVLLQEDAVRDGDELRLRESGSPSPRHIRRAGFDFAQGDELRSAGRALGPVDLALARMAGLSDIAVRARARLTVIDCGDELVSDPAAAVGAHIPATNGAMIAAMAKELVSECRQIGPVGDSRDALIAAFADADRADSDVLVISGGASVGNHDLVKPALQEWGASLAFWRVAMRPGKPLLVARKGRRIVLGLPGNPVSAYVTAFLFLLPLLRHFGGSATPFPPALRLPLTAPLSAGGTRTEFLRAIVGPEGVTPIMERDSSALCALARANGLIRRDIAAPETHENAFADVYLL